ncbi:2-oxo acid dehydrogenase subunit E2 [Micrococcales bacterium 31B]|nr:2-oxo acid dehydrogenase subunit E2 [Micrococcales bacterium 31B]
MPQYEFFNLPDAGEGLTEADIIEWRVKAGDTITINQVLVEVETAKSLVELPSPFDGVVVEILVEAGATANVGDPIIRVDLDPGGAEAAPEPSQPAADEAGAGSGGARVPTLVGYGVQPGATQRRKRATVPTEPAVPGPLTDPSVPQVEVSRILTKPPVRKLAKDLGIALADVLPSGKEGTVTREDVLAHFSTATQEVPAAPAPAAASATASDLVAAMPTSRSVLRSPVPGIVSGERTTRIAIRSVRKRTAEAMVSSAFTAPHVTVFHTVDVTRTMNLVERLKADKEWADVRVSPLLIVAKALLVAIRRNPEVNASWDEAAQEIVYKHYVNLGIAASTPRGLIVPHIPDAHLMNLRELADELRDLTLTARAGKTPLARTQDTTISITNVGVFGIDTGTPILNPGEAAILAFGAIARQPWVHNGKVKPRWVTQLALSFDHRLVDGELGARVLRDVASVLEDPAMGLVWI